MTHEFNGSQYARASVLQQDWGMRLMAELGLQGTERVLDLGGGDGTLTARLADANAETTIAGTVRESYHPNLNRIRERHLWLSSYRHYDSYHLG